MAVGERQVLMEMVRNKKRTRRLAVVVLSHYCHHNSVIAQNHCRLFLRKCERITLTSLPRRFVLIKVAVRSQVSEVKVTLSCLR